MAGDAAGGVGVGVVAPAVGGVLPGGPPYIVCMPRSQAGKKPMLKVAQDKHKNRVDRSTRPMYPEEACGWAHEQLFNTT